MNSLLKTSHQEFFSKSQQKMNSLTYLFLRSNFQLMTEISFVKIYTAAMIPAVNPSQLRLIENYSQLIFTQSYGFNHHATPAANRNFFHEINPAVMIPAGTED